MQARPGCAAWPQARATARGLARIGTPPYPRPRTWIIKQRWSFDTDPELQAWSKRALRMVLTAPGMSLAEVYRFNSAIMFYPQPLYEETMAWTAPREFGVPVHLLHGGSDQHALTSLVEEYYPAVEAPGKSLTLLPGGGHCVTLAQPEVFLAGLRGFVVNGAPSGTSGPGSC